MAEHLPVLFRGTTADDATTQAKEWARGEGLRVRTIATVKRRHDLPTWGADDDPRVSLFAFEVTLVVDTLPAELPLPTLPEAPTLPLWGAA